MKGATYVTVEADAAFVMPMNASGGTSIQMGKLTWSTSGGITEKGWDYDGTPILENAENLERDQIDTKIQAFFNEITSSGGQTGTNAGFEFLKHWGPCFSW